MYIGHLLKKKKLFLNIVHFGTEKKKNIHEKKLKSIFFKIFGIVNILKLKCFLILINKIKSLLMF